MLKSGQTQLLLTDGVWINNNAVIIAERSSIRIGANTLIATEFTVYDSDFHDLHAHRHFAGTDECAPVNIGKNVFIGSRVMILKGVTIGDNAVIALDQLLLKMFQILQSSAVYLRILSNVLTRRGRAFCTNLISQKFQSK